MRIHGATTYSGGSRAFVVPDFRTPTASWVTAIDCLLDFPDETVRGQVSRCTSLISCSLSLARGVRSLIVGDSPVNDHVNHPIRLIQHQMTDEFQTESWS